MKTVSRVILSAIFLVLTAVLTAVAHFSPALVFSVWPEASEKLLSLLATVTAPFPFAVWEVLVLLVILWAVYTLVRCFSRHRGVLNWLSGVLLGAMAAVFTFTLIWGLGHYGPDVGEKIGLEVREYSQEELYEAAVYYTELANESAAKIQRDGDSMVEFPAFSELAKQAPAAFETLASQERFSAFRGGPAKVKKLTAAKLYSYFGTTGVFVPFTGESSVNPDTFVVSLPFTMCHEVAHRLGVPAEDGANFSAFLACEHSGSDEFLYSGRYSAFLYCYNALYAENKTLAGEIWAMASPELQADCRAASAHYDPYEGKVQDAAQKVNDVYLKAFQEEEGVRSYGAAADYLIAWYLERRG